MRALHGHAGGEATAGGTTQNVVCPAIPVGRRLKRTSKDILVVCLAGFVCAGVVPEQGQQCRVLGERGPFPDSVRGLGPRDARHACLAERVLNGAARDGLRTCVRPARTNSTPGLTPNTNHCVCSGCAQRWQPVPTPTARMDKKPSRRQGVRRIGARVWCRACRGWRRRSGARDRF